MSAEDIYRHLLNMNEEIGIATVYRVLTQFEQAGLVIRHNFDSDHAVYELNDESPHEHLICTVCGAVIEFENPSLVKQLNEIAQQHTFQLESHSLHLYGRCKDGNCEASLKD